jgi:hypothetical protein
MWDPQKSLLQIAIINRLLFVTYNTAASAHVDFFLGFRHPIRSSARILQRSNYLNRNGSADKFIIDMAKV